MTTLVNQPTRADSLRIEPTTSRTIFGESLKIYGFGRVPELPNLNWTLKGIETSPNPIATHTHVVQALQRIVYLTDIYAPPPDTFNSVMTSVGDLRVEGMPRINLGPYKTLYRGIKADGVYGLRPHDGYAMSSADCALLVVKWRKLVFAAHAGRNSLMDRLYIDTHGAKQSKNDKSVVDAIMAKITPEYRHETEVYIGFAISAGRHFQHPIDHPQLGLSNRKMIDWVATHYMSEEEKQNVGVSFWTRGEIDLGSIIRKQFLAYGVQDENIASDGLCTYTNKDEKGYHWNSQARDKDGSRNLVIVMCIR